MLHSAARLLIVHSIPISGRWRSPWKRSPRLPVLYMLCCPIASYDCSMSRIFARNRGMRKTEHLHSRLLSPAVRQQQRMCQPDPDQDRRCQKPPERRRQKQRQHDHQPQYDRSQSPKAATPSAHKNRPPRCDSLQHMREAAFIFTFVDHTPRTCAGRSARTGARRSGNGSAISPAATARVTAQSGSLRCVQS